MTLNYKKIMAEAHEAGMAAGEAKVPVPMVVSEHENMLDMNEVRSFASGVTQYSNRFSVMDESEIARIVILQNKKRFTDRYLSAYQETN